MLQLITLSEMGGAQKVLYHLVASLNPDLFDITVACAPGGELIQWLKDLDHIKVVEINNLKRNISPINDLRVFCQLYRFMHCQKFDLVHCHSSKAGILGRLAAYLAGVRKIFFTVHGWGVNYYQGRLSRLVYSLIERLAGKISTKVICVSNADLKKGLDLRLASPDKLIVIHNGLPKVNDKPGKLRQELGLKEEDIVIGMVARLAEPKQPLFFLEVAGRMLERRHLSTETVDLLFVLIGDGPLKGKCEDYIKSHKLEDNVFLVGNRENARELIMDFNVFVLFSRWEGLPLTIIEAMLAGKPVVANDVGGVRELVEQNETGLIVKELNVELALAVLQELIDNPELGRQMGERGKRKVEIEFNLKRMVDRYIKVYLS